MAEVLTELSLALAGAVEAAGPSVVRVEARSRIPASGIVWSADGVIVTASHVVRREEGIIIGVDNEGIPAALVGRDPATDVAVLRSEASGLAPAHWADPQHLKVGHLTLALGRPGRTVRATMGIVSAMGDGWRTPAGGRLDRYLLADVVMHPGFSGGPLVDVAGNALAMNTSGLLRTGTPSISASDLDRLVNALLSHGSVRRGYLGITPQPARLPETLADRLGQPTGLLVTFTEPGTPAEQAGVTLGDVIVAIDGRQLRHIDDLFAALTDLAGRTASLTVVRAGEVREVSVEVGERGER